MRCVPASDRRVPSGGCHPQDYMIVALARKLLIELWRLATTGQVPRGGRPALGAVADRPVVDD